ncbi:MAG TPA: shikimate kinase [Rhizobiaceae bacterium]|nr:shikimate kinase [Rhizobiaceae bacterium]
MTAAELSSSTDIERLRAALGTQTIVFVGLMGAGKTAIGRKVAAALELPFVDSDHEIELVSRMTVPELFSRYGEAEFRALEQRVILRLLAEGPHVLATGGGAYMNAETRMAIRQHGMSIWLRADLDTLMGRVAKKQNRPLLQTADPRGTMKRLMDERYPVYAEADVCVDTRDDRRETIATEVIAALAARITGEGVTP